MCGPARRGGGGGEERCPAGLIPWRPVVGGGVILLHRACVGLDDLGPVSKWNFQKNMLLKLRYFEIESLT